MNQWEFNQLMRGYYREIRGKKFCSHNPQVMLFYRLSVVFNLGIIAGILMKGSGYNPEPWEGLEFFLIRYKFMKFSVEVTETLSRILTVEAPTYEQAEEKIQEMYENCDIVLKADDIVEQRVNLFDDDVPDDHPVDVIVCRHSDIRDSLYRAVCNECEEEN